MGNSRPNSLQKVIGDDRAVPKLSQSRFSKALYRIPFQSCELPFALNHDP
jgi:hypothetical protein